MALPIWIERGPDGRPYYIKKKPTNISVKHSFTDIILPLRRRDHLPGGNMASIPVSQRSLEKQKQQPNQRTNIVDNSDSRHSTPIQQPRAQTPNQRTTMQAIATSSPVNNQMVLKPAEQQPLRYPNTFDPLQRPPQPLQQNIGPHPSQIPYSGPIPPFHYQPPVQPVHLVHHPSFVPSTLDPPFLGQPFPPSTANQPARHKSALNLLPKKLRHTCGDCGRTRSAKYHHEHPIRPGQIPTIGTCGKCVKKLPGTDESGDESATSNTKNKHRSRKSRATSRPKSITRVRVLTQKSDKIRTERQNNLYRNEPENSDSTSSSEVQERASRSRNMRSPSVEIVRIVETPRSHVKQRRRTTVYLKDISSDEESSSYARDQGLSYSNHSPSGRNRIDQTASKLQEFHRPDPRPNVRPAILVNGREQSNDFPVHTTYQPYTRSHRPTPRSYSRPPNVRVSRPSHHRTEGRVVGTIHSQEDSENRSARIRERSIGRYSNHDGGAEDDVVVEVHELISRSPSPAAIPQSLIIGPHTVQPLHHLNDDYKGVRHGFGLPALNRHAVTVKKESSSMTNRREPRPKDDYDWYDENGMRVRVREI